MKKILLKNGMFTATCRHPRICRPEMAAHYEAAIMRRIPKRAYKPLRWSKSLTIKFNEISLDI